MAGSAFYSILVAIIEDECVFDRINAQGMMLDFTKGERERDAALWQEGRKTIPMPPHALCQFQTMVRLCLPESFYRLRPCNRRLCLLSRSTDYVHVIAPA